MLQILQRDEEAVFVLLSKHMGYGVTEGIPHMRRDAEPGLSSLHLTGWDEHNLPCHLTQLFVLPFSGAAAPTPRQQPHFCCW